MWSYAWCIGAGALLLAGITSSSDLVPILFNVGESFEASVETSFLPENAFSCSLKTPAGNIVKLRPEFDGNPNKYDLRTFNPIHGCSVSVEITDKSDEGTWTVHFTPNTGEPRQAEYKIAVYSPILKDFDFILDLARMAITESSSRMIENLPEEFFNTTLGNKLEVKINYYDFVHTESCHIITPDGEEYNLKELASEGIKEIQDFSVACGVEIDIKDESLVGKWTLFSRDMRHSNPIERRLNFTIHIEEVVKAIPGAISIAEGNNLHFRLEKPTPLHKTCKLITPDGNDRTEYLIDENRKEECGFIAPKARINDTGTWEIVYGQRITYKAPVMVTVNAAIEEERIVLNWVQDRAVNELLGPEDAVYCRIADPEGLVLFEGFGRCHIALERVREHHGGDWLMTFGTPGRVLTEDRNVTVVVSQAAQHPRVITHVEAQKPDIVLKCSLEGHHDISSCKFRDPSGRVLLATEGVGDDRYSFHGIDVSLESNVTTTGCGLRIRNPVYSEQGLWRCAMQAADGTTSFGFLKVLCPFAVSQAGDTPIVTEPILTAAQHVVTTQGTESVFMSCSVQSEIRYCYFRAPNGTVFSVSPSTNSDILEYLGSGLDAGECGARFRRLGAAEAGRWGCHAGFPDITRPEQRAVIVVHFQRPLSVSQYLVGSWTPEHASLVVEAQVDESRPLEYCRFVRIDGLGFTSATLPGNRYTSRDHLARGKCGLQIQQPSTLDHHPWTIFTKIVGQDVEISGTTEPTLEEPTGPSPDPGPSSPSDSRATPVGYLWVLFIMLGLAIILLSLNMTTKKPRQWASSVRESFRRTKAPLPEAAPPSYTPQA